MYRIYAPPNAYEGSLDLSLPPSGVDLSECLKSFEDSDLESLACILRIAVADTLDRPTRVERCLEILGNSDQFKNRQEVIDCFIRHHFYKAANM